MLNQTKFWFSKYSFLGGGDKMLLDFLGKGFQEMNVILVHIYQNLIDYTCTFIDFIAINTF